MISASSFSFLEEVVVPLSLLAIPGLLAVLLDVVEDELAAGVGKGAALAGLTAVRWRRPTSAATAAVVVVVVAIVCKKGCKRRNKFV